MLTQIVIFGASGDLTSRKLAPAVYNAHYEKLFSTEIQMVGVARRDWDDAFFREHLTKNLPGKQSGEEEDWDKFLEKVHYFQVHLDSSDGYGSLSDGLDAFGR